MGVVYKAEDTKLRRTVALKFLSPHLLADPRQKQRFLHEAQAAAALDHPNISTIHEVHEADGHTFMVMAFIEGEDVGTRIESGSLTVESALDIAIQVARGLVKAHGAGVIHRDIKPGNVIVTDDGVAKIVDFGLAKLATQTKLTKTGTSVGTVRYMSPEQATGRDADHRTDVWSLGVMLYEMLTGELPFRGDVEQALIYSIINGDPRPVTELRKDVPVGIEDVIEKSLEKDPDKRYATMDSMLADLERQRDQLTLGIKERRFTSMRRLRRRKRLVGVFAGVLILVLVLSILQTFRGKGTGIDAIAVLPFSNLSGDDEQEYFSDGMTESLINELGQISALRVISRTSVMRYKKTDKSLQDIADDLEIDAVVEASVIRSGDRIRIAAQLIRVDPEQVLWSESYNRDGRDVAIVLGEVTRAIADRIEVAVNPREAERLAQVRTVDPDALDAVLRGRYHRFTWTEEGMRRGLQYMQDAIAIDPAYALAYEGLADCYLNLGLFSYMPLDDVIPKAKAAALRALELDESLGAVHAMLGWIKFIYDWDWYGPDADFQRAVELSPNDVDVHQWYGAYLTVTGRFEEGIAESYRMIDVDPLSGTNYFGLAWSYAYARQWDKALEVALKAQKAGYSGGFGTLAWIYSEKGMHDTAVAYCDSVLAHAGDERGSLWLSGIGRVCGLAGHRERAEAILDELVARSKTTYVNPIHIAQVCKGLGRTDEMFQWLEKGYEMHSPSIVFLRLDYGQFHDDPRYQDLLRRVGIPLD